MLKGVLLVLSACLVWGLNFVIPEFMIDFGPLEIALVNYFFLGLLSSLFMGVNFFSRKQSFPWSIWRQAILYALAVNILYYLALVTGLRYSGASVIAILLGISPITVSFYGNWRQKECSYRNLFIPSLLIACGLICINWTAFTSLSGEATWEYGLGLLCGLFSLVIWNWYMVENAKFLKENPDLSSSDCSNLVGAATFGWVILIGLIFLLILPSDHFIKYTVWNSSLASFLIGGLILGVFSSWLGSYFWNLGNQALPIFLAGQLTIFETIFGLIFVYLVEQRLPAGLEFTGILSVLSGVSLSMFHFSKQPSFRTPVRGVS